MSQPPSPPPPPSAEEFEARSLAAVKAGQLPLRAQQRLADLRAHNAWTSDLSVSEFDVLGSVGFSPVGQVMGTSVYQIGWSGTVYCGGGGRWGGGYSPTPVEATPLVRSLYDARSRALTRMQMEAQMLGADGVVGVELHIRPFLGAQHALEFQAIGTAVRAAGPVHPPVPFLSDLSGQDFVKLVLAGWVPTGIAMGISVLVRHDDYRTRGQASRWSYSNEISGYTELVQASRDHARDALDADVRRLGGEGVVVRDMNLRVREQECRAYVGQDNGRDHVAEVTILGTAIARFSRTKEHTGPRTLPILRLSTRTTEGVT